MLKDHDGSASFLKKRSKKLLLMAARGGVCGVKRAVKLCGIMIFEQK
jgi:hypothetical protein